MISFTFENDHRPIVMFKITLVSHNFFLESSGIHDTISDELIFFIYCLLSSSPYPTIWKCLSLNFVSFYPVSSKFQYLQVSVYMNDMKTGITSDQWLKCLDSHQKSFSFYFKCVAKISQSVSCSWYCDNI